MNLLCLLLGHRWFKTVITHHRWQSWDAPILELDEYVECICLRCQDNLAAHVVTLDSWNYVLDPTSEPSWADEPSVQHLPLPGNW